MSWLREMAGLLREWWNVEREWMSVKKALRLKVKELGEEVARGK